MEIRMKFDKAISIAKGRNNDLMSVENENECYLYEKSTALAEELMKLKQDEEIPYNVYTKFIFSGIITIETTFGGKPYCLLPDKYYKFRYIFPLEKLEYYVEEQSVRLKYNEYDIFINFKCEEKCYYVFVTDLKKRLVLKKCTTASFIYACENIFSKSEISAVKELINANIILMNMNEKKLLINI